MDARTENDLPSSLFLSPFFSVFCQMVSFETHRAICSLHCSGSSSQHILGHCQELNSSQAFFPQSNSPLFLLHVKLWKKQNFIPSAPLDHFATLADYHFPATLINKLSRCFFINYTRGGRKEDRCEGVIWGSRKRKGDWREAGERRKSSYGERRRWRKRGKMKN